MEGEQGGMGGGKNGARITAGPEGRVHIEAAVTHRQIRDHRMDEHGNVTGQSASGGGSSAVAAPHHSRAPCGPSAAIRELNCFLSARTFAVASASLARKPSGSQ